MRSRALVLLLALLPLALLIGCFGVSIDVSAEETFTSWDLQSTLEFYGREIPFQYTLDGTTYRSTFYQRDYYSTRNYISGLNILANDVISSSDFPDFLVYSTDALNISPSSLLSINVPLDIYYTGGFRAMIGTCVNFGTVTDSKNLISSYPDNVFGLYRALSANSVADSSLSDYYNYGTINFRSNTGTYTNIPSRFLTIDDSDNAVASIRFQGVSSLGADYRLYLFVGFPSSSGDVSHDSPVTTSVTSGTGDINVNVNVDMTETNGLLGSILDAISSLGSSIVNGIKNIFLPDQEDILNWKQTIVNILNETFGGIPELEEQLKNAISSIFSATARETVRFEGIKVPAAAGEPEAVIVPAQDVPLKPSGFGDLFSWAETFINIVATIAVANTCFNQIKRIVVGEVVVDAD